MDGDENYFLYEPSLEEILKNGRCSGDKLQCIRVPGTLRKVAVRVVCSLYLRNRVLCINKKKKWYEFGRTQDQSFVVADTVLVEQY